MTASLQGSTCTHARVAIPSHGRWWADVTIAGEVTLSGSVTLTLADVDYVGAVVMGGFANGRSGYRIVGGSGGWGLPIGSKAYANDAGVRRSTVAGDAATDAEESVELSGLSGTVGPAYVREAGPAAYVLDYVAPRAWRVDADGTTRFGSRTVTEVTSYAARVRVDPGAGVLVLASPTLAALVPGATVDGLTAVDVVHELTPESGLRTTLHGSPWGHSRRVEALRRLVRTLLPEYRWHGRYEYRIVVQESERLTLQPALTALGLPDLRRVPVRPGVPGVKASHKYGSLVEVAFTNGDRSRPVVVSFDDADASGFLPDDMEIEADGIVGIGPTPRLGAARLNDVVVCGGFGGTITNVLGTGVEIG